mgnify:FL=1|tara:strand:- start:438 stop:1172 length:735 start_codon:yes stop_codon:yes gene_type:complete
MSLKILNISQYFDATFLKTSAELGITDDLLEEKINLFINETVDYNFKCVMLRPNFVALAKKIISKRSSSVRIGTVIDFPLGNQDTEVKINEAKLAIKNGVDELDFVCDYNIFKMGHYDIFDQSILNCTKLVLEKNIVVKWIIETGALSKNEIRQISKRIFNVCLSNFPNKMENIFVKTSTGYYGGLGATQKDVKSIKSIVSPMPVKASGGVSDLSSCIKMIEAGADRIGTSRADIIYNEWKKIN